MHIFRKIKKIEAQHTAEYIILLTLIMAGIIIAGPYVIRSWNANLKGWEDSVYDSLADPLLPSPDDPVFADCTAEDWKEQKCGLQALNVCTDENVACTLRQMLWTRDFNPPGCQCALPESPETARCEFDDRCCEYIPGLCGVAGGCPDGQRQYLAYCGASETPKNVCGYIDPPGSNNFIPGEIDPLCIFHCIGPPTADNPDPPYFNGIEYDGFCPGDDVGLPQDIHHSFVLHGKCTDETMCETQCEIGYFPATIAGIPYCKTCEEFGIDIGNCPEGQYDPQGCSEGYYMSCCLEDPSASNCPSQIFVAGDHDQKSCPAISDGQCNSCHSIIGGNWCTACVKCVNGTLVEQANCCGSGIHVGCCGYPTCCP